MPQVGFLPVMAAVDRLLSVKSDPQGPTLAAIDRLLSVKSDPPTQTWQKLRQTPSILNTFGPSWEIIIFCTQKLDFGHPPRIGKICVQIYGFWALLGRSWENLLFGFKNLILATHPELANFVSKSIDSGYFWADPGKICFLLPKT